MSRQLRATQYQEKFGRATNQMTEKDKTHADDFEIGQKGTFFYN